jgi:hypothetical protein
MIAAGSMRLAIQSLPAGRDSPLKLNVYDNCATLTPLTSTIFGVAASAPLR